MAKKPDPSPAHTALRRWFREEYERRTKALDEGTGRVDWINSSTRVSWSDLLTKAEELGITDHPVELRLWWHS